MHATLKLRSRLPRRDVNSGSNSPTIVMASRRDIQLSTKRASRSHSSTTPRTDYRHDHSSATDVPPIKWRRNSSAEIPIPSFMIPCSASSLMNMHYALPSSDESEVPFASYGTAISQR